jgi:hypothetical protein
VFLPVLPKVSGDVEPLPLQDLDSIGLSLVIPQLLLSVQVLVFLLSMHSVHSVQLQLGVHLEVLPPLPEADLHAPASQPFGQLVDFHSVQESESQLPHSLAELRKQSFEPVTHSSVHAAVPETHVPPWHEQLPPVQPVL